MSEGKQSLYEQILAAEIEATARLQKDKEGLASLLHRAAQAQEQRIRAEQARLVQGLERAWNRGRDREESKVEEE